MSAMLPARRVSREVRLADAPRPTPASAGLKKSETVGSSPEQSVFGHGQMIWDSLVRGHGSVKATAIQMGNRDESQLKRQIVNGTLRIKEFFDADEAALCEFAEWVLTTFQPARKSSKERAVILLVEAQQKTYDALQLVLTEPK